MAAVGEPARRVLWAEQLFIHVCPVPMSHRRRQSTASAATPRSAREHSALKSFRSTSIASATTRMDEDDDSGEYEHSAPGSACSVSSAGSKPQVRTGL